LGFFRLDWAFQAGMGIFRLDWAFLGIRFWLGFGFLWVELAWGWAFSGFYFATDVALQL